MTTARTLILYRLAASTKPLAVHEIKAEGVSDTSCSARLREMARDGVVVSIPVPGKRYTAWCLAADDPDLL